MHNIYAWLNLYINLQNAGNQRHNTAAQPSAPPLGLMKKSKDKRSSSGPSTSYRNETHVSESIQVELQNQSQFIRPEDVLVCDKDIVGGLKGKSSLDNDVSTARHRLRRFIDGK